MRIGYVLVTCESGFERAVMKKLLSIKHVADASVLFGMYDIIIKLESVTYEMLRELIIWKIRKIERIRSIVILMGREPVSLLTKEPNL